MPIPKNISPFGFTSLLVCLLKNDFNINRFNYEELEKFIILNNPNELYESLLKPLKLYENNGEKYLPILRENLTKLSKLGTIFIDKEEVIISDNIPLYQVIINYQEFIKPATLFIKDFITYSILSVKQDPLSKEKSDYEISRKVLERRLHIIDDIKN